MSIVLLILLSCSFCSVNGRRRKHRDGAHELPVRQAVRQQAPLPDGCHRSTEEALLLETVRF